MRLARAAKWNLLQSRQSHYRALYTSACVYVHTYALTGIRVMHARTRIRRYPGGGVRKEGFMRYTFRDRFYNYTAGQSRLRRNKKKKKHK